MDEKAQQKVNHGLVAGVGGILLFVLNWILPDWAGNSPDHWNDLDVRICNQIVEVQRSPRE